MVDPLQTGLMIDQMRDESLTLPRPQVLIMGASTRAAAMSALRAGFDPWCVDQFADADLKAICQVAEVESFSIAGARGDALRRQLRELRQIPVIPAGGLENHLSLVEELQSAGHPFWGSPVGAMRQVRNPMQLAAGLAELKQRMLEVRPADEPPPRDGSWVAKPIGSAGGRNIHVWDEGCETPSIPHYFQRRVKGAFYSALFLAEAQPGDVRFVGLTRQLVGLPELNASQFAWCGNIGPVFLPVETEFLVRRWGNILKWKFGLTGLFGIDFVIDECGQAWLLEVNPRLTGAVEILELACGVNLLADHVACYATEAAAQAWEFASPPMHPGGDRLGRAILYTSIRVQSHIPVPDSVEWETAPEIADIPKPRSIIEAGQPVCSVYAWGDDETDVMARLLEKVGHVKTLMTRCD